MGMKGALVLTTPTHLGNGDTDATTDMPIVLDEATGKALLPGTSLAATDNTLMSGRKDMAMGVKPRRANVPKSMRCVR